MYKRLLVFGTVMASCLGVALGNPPGVPEPGLVVWGVVVNANNPAEQIPVTSASWSVTDGSKTAVYTGSSKPPVRIFSMAGNSYYVVEVPFDTRRFGNLVVLADPAEQGIDSFELKSASPPTYLLTPIINGVFATVRSVDGAPLSGGNFSLSGFTATSRGKVIRADLAIVPPTTGYDAWASTFFGAGNPAAAKTADPDGDGLSNEMEFGAGTNPTNQVSVLSILTVSVGPTQATVEWKSINTRSYVVEAASDVNGPWVEVSSAVPGAIDNTETAVSRVPGDSHKFYRVRVNVPQ